MSGGSVVTAIIRREDHLLMVRQQGQDDPEPSWFVPGGRVEPGELLHEALVREVKEETGLDISAPTHLGWVSQHDLDDPKWGGVWTAFGFEVPDPGGNPMPADPDGIVLSAEWIPISQAIDLIGAIPHGPMRDPVVGYLNGTADVGSLWIWRLDSTGSDSPLLTLHAALHMPANVAD